MTNNFHTKIPKNAPGHSWVVNRRLGKIDEGIGRISSRLQPDGTLDLGAGDFSQNHVVLNGAHLWVDGNGNPRFNADTPTANDDGVILRGKDAPPPEPVDGGDIIAPVNTNPTIFADLAGNINTVSSLVSATEQRMLAGTGRTGSGTGGFIYSIDDPYTTANFLQSAGAQFVYRFANLGGGKMLAGTGPYGRIHRSTDFGATWRDVGASISGRHGAETRALLPRGIVVLAGVNRTGTVWRSNDEGASWIQSSRGIPAGVTNVWDFAVGTGGRIHAACGLPAAIYYTDDLGASWIAPTTQPDRGTDISAVAAFPDGRMVAGGSVTFGRATVFLSDDGGVTWRARFDLEDPPGRRGGLRITNLLPLGGNRMLLATGTPGQNDGGNIYETTDRGESWTWRLAPGPNTNFIGEMVRHQGQVYCTASGGSRRVYQIIP